MASVVETEVVPAEGERRILLRGVGWQGYQTLLNLGGDGPIRITYDRGDAELMSPLIKHERNRSILGRLVEIITEELDIPLMSAGATTLNREDLDRGLEADESFYLGDLSRVSDADDLDLKIDPPPDLAIEIEITRSVLSRLSIYGALGVPEVWRFDGRRLRILDRQSDGTYREIDQSQCLPWLTVTDLTRFLTEENARDETTLARNFRGWVRETIVPRVKGGHGGE
jgi:Uma2 family endonuclease